MAWSAPATPAGGTAITVAFYNTNIRDNLNHIRAITGGADPGGSDKALVSTGSATAQWKLLPDAALADQKISQTNVAGRTNANTAELTGFFEYSSGASNIPTAAYYLIQNVRQANFGAHHAGQVAFPIAGGNVYHRTIASGTPTTWAKIWDDQNLDPTTIVPSGLIAAFRTAAAIAAGWTRFTDGDGRMLIGAGTTFSVTFTENTAVGSSWSHQHAATGLTATSGTVPVLADGQTVLVNNGATTSVATSTHTHPAPTVTMGGNSANTAWQEPARIVVWAIKT